MKTFTNIPVTRITAPGEEALGIEPGKAQNLFDAITRIYTTQNVFDPKGNPAGLANNFRFENGGIVADVELSSPSPWDKFVLVVMLGGQSGKAAYRAGRVSAPDILHMVIGPDTTESTRMALEAAKTMLSSGNAAGRNFADVVNHYAAKGVANPFAKAIISHPDLYNVYRQSFNGPASTRLAAKKQSDETQLAAGDVSMMHAELRAIDRLPAKDRAAGILKLSRKNPTAYNAARSRGLL